MNFIPMPGHAFITPESRFIDTGPIEIPERYRQKKKAVAIVKDWKRGNRFKCRCGQIQHVKGACRNCQRRDRMKSISAVPVAPFNADITGMRVIYVESAVNRISDDLYSLPIDDIIAIIDKDVELDSAEGVSGVKRCKFCGPAKDGTKNAVVMLKKASGFVCPRCKRDETGVIQK